MNYDNEQKYYVYILLHNEEKIFKIGKSKNLENRVCDLEDTWGEFSKDHSYVFVGSENQISNLERLLHRLFINYKVYNLSKGTGYTEFFYIEALQILINFEPMLKTFGIDVNFFKLSEVANNWVGINNKTLDKKIMKFEEKRSDSKLNTVVLTRKEKQELILDYGILKTSELEIKYKLSFGLLKTLYSNLTKKLSKDHKERITNIKKIKTQLSSMEDRLKKSLKV